MTNKKHPASGWIKHTPGEPRPVPVEWIKAVKDGSGYVFFAKGGAKRPCGEWSHLKDWGERFTDNDLWRDEDNHKEAITHYRLKKKYRRAYAEQQEPEMKPKPLITHEITEQVTVACAETGRSITLDKKIYDEKAEVVDHWLRGGEVEFKNVAGSWVLEEAKTPQFGLLEYRIMPRQPVAGEVWEVDCGTDNGDENYRPVVWLTDDGFLRAYFFADSHAASHNDLSTTGADWPKRYAASSLQEYIARQIWESNKDGALMTEITKSLLAACNYD